MTDQNQVIKHLEIIQTVINRLANNSFLIKGWSMAILSVAVLFISRYSSQCPQVILIFLIPVIGFWILDSYFLWHERLFRNLYNAVRKRETTDFALNISAHKNRPKCKWYYAFFSITLIIFYSIEIFFLVVASLVLQ